MTPFLLSLLIIIFPLTHLPFVPQQMLGIPGNNPVNFVWIAAFILTFVNSRKIHRPSSPFFRLSFIFFLAAYSIAALWTTVDIDSLHPTLRSQQLSSSGFLISYYFKSLQIIITGLIAYKYCLSSEPKTIETAISLIPVVLLPFIAYYYYLGSHGGLDYRMGREVLSQNIGLNANEIGGLAVAILAYNLGKVKELFTKIDYLSMASSLVVIVFSLSRMAFIATLLIFIISLRKLTIKQKITSLGLLMIVVLAFTPLLVSRINYGISNKDGKTVQTKEVNANDLSAGRVEYIWKPCLSMIADKPILGDGLLSIWKGKYIVKKSILKPAHPHNAYLEIALDMGSIGLIIFLFFIKSFWQISKLNKGFKYALITWLIMGLSGSTFYPALYTLPIWIYYAITCAKMGEEKIAIDKQRVLL